MYKYIGRTGTNGFINGNVYRLKYEFTAGMLFVRTPRGKLNFAIESKRMWENNFKEVAHDQSPTKRHVLCRPKQI